MIKKIIIKDTTLSLSSFAKRVQGDLKYIDGKLDTKNYDSDPQTPNPNGSSGFPNSLYILTEDGFIIERNHPISGYLDSSDFKKLLTYDKVQTIHDSTDKKWRVLSSPIVFNGVAEGVLLVSVYNPRDTSLSQIDSTLLNEIKEISSLIEFKNNKLSVDRIDVRHVYYDVSFEVVNKYNILLLNNGRTPTLIDPSYFYKEVKRPDVEKIFDNTGKNEYIIYRQKIFDNKDQLKGLIVVGKSMMDIEKQFKLFLYNSILIGVLIVFPFEILTLLYLLWPLKKRLIQNNFESNYQPKKIVFNKKSGVLNVDGKKIEIPYSSNQYYLLISIFSNPKKRWEYDILLEKIGDSPEQNSDRKIYDAMLAINKKVGFKLILLNAKTYFLNPQFQSIVTLS